MKGKSVQVLPITRELTDEVSDLIADRLVHEVHTSERKSFRGCRRRWNWVFQQFYYPQVTAKPLEFGVAFHSAMEVLYDPDTWTWDRELILNAAIGKFADVCNEQKTKFLKDGIDSSFLTEKEVEEEYEERIKLGVGMLSYYQRKVASVYDVGWKPLQVEAEFIVPIQDPDTGNYLFCKCPRCIRTIDIWVENNLNLDNVSSIRDHLMDMGLPVCLAGRIDMLAEDEHNNLFIVDWKTTARLARGDVSGQDRDEFLENDDQIGSYVMALVRKLRLDVKGFVYVELKKAFPQEPVQNIARRLGRLYSVNKNQAVDYDTYLECISKNDTEAYESGLYDDYLLFLRESGERFHGRYKILKTPEELEEIERNLWYEALEMCNPHTVSYPSPGRFNCATCAFRQPCLEMNRKSDYQTILDTMFDRRKEHYWVKDRNTDKRGNE